MAREYRGVKDDTNMGKCFLARPLRQKSPWPGIRTMLGYWLLRLSLAGLNRFDPFYGWLLSNEPTLMSLLISLVLRRWPWVRADLPK